MKIKKFIQKHRVFLSFSLFLLCFCFFLMLFLRIDIDYYWHYKAGEYMVQHSKILTTDVFSWSLYQFPWISHEWLFEVFLYTLSMIFGKFHLFVYVFFTTLFLLFFLFLPQRKEYLKNIPFALFWTIFFALIFTSLSGRPQLLSFLFLAFSVWIIYYYFYHPDSKRIYFLPILSLFWANVHGGSSNLPYLLCFLAIFCGLFSFSFSKMEAIQLSKKQIITYFVVAVLCMIAVCINPHGFTMFVYPYQNMGDHLMLSTITEWQPSNLNIISHYIYFFFALMTFLVMLFSKKKIRFFDFVFYLFFLYLGLKSIRFWFFSYIVWSLFIFYYVPRRKLDSYSCLLIVVVSVLFLLVFLRGFSYSDILSNKTLSDKAISVLREERPKRLFNYYDYGAYLIYQDIPVFVDGRADLYSKYTYEDYQDISRLHYQFPELISKYQFDYFIVPKESGLASYLKSTPDYSLIYQDKKCSIFKTKEKC